MTRIAPAQPAAVPVAYRVWTTRHTSDGRNLKPRRRPRRRVNQPAKLVLIIDTETRVDVGQGLLYGAYWFCHTTKDGTLRCLEEGLFYADDLPETSPTEYGVLRRYVTEHPARVDHSDPAARRRIRLLSRDEFIEDVVWRGGYQARATIVMFNAPFDWSRLAISAGRRRRSRRAHGATDQEDIDDIRGPATGFSFAFYRDRARYRPRLGVDHLDSKRAMMRFVSPEVIDFEDRQHLDDDIKAFGGNFLDLRTLVYALTGNSHSLRSACEAFGVEHGKSTGPAHGRVPPEHIDYCRDDVRATAELYEKAAAEYSRHPITKPDGDVLPVRARYGDDRSFTIGLNSYTDPQPRWYTHPDLIAATLLTGRPPRVLKGYRYIPHGTQSGLQPIRLRGETLVDPARQDPFKLATEQRQRLKKTLPSDHPEGCGCPDCQRVQFLKTFANSGCYGIFAEINRNPAKNHTVNVHAGLPQPWQTDVETDEVPGTLCFPPLAACITAAARLMLALLERLVTDAGGTWVFCDTDSMAIVTTTDGGLIPATGGLHRQGDGTTAVRALSDHQIDGILDRFAQLNPYNPDAVRGTILRRVDNGRGHAYAISAKRYAIYNPEALAAHCHAHAAGQPIMGNSPILKRSEHGLGHLLNPLHPDDIDNRNWIDELWTVILAHQAGHPVPWPDWIDQPALSRYTVTSPHLSEPFKPWNTANPWDQQVKPFNFMLIAHVARGDRPIAASDDFQLVAPYTSNPDEWERLNWIDRAHPDSPPWQITTTGPTDESARTVAVQTYAEVLHTFRKHPEAKYADTAGQPCAGTTVGALNRRAIQPATISYLGKEADKIDEVQTGLVTDPNEVITDYRRSDTFQDRVLPVLENLTAPEVADRILHGGSGGNRSALIRAIQRSRAGASPRLDIQQAITDVALLEIARSHPCHGRWPLARLREHEAAVLLVRS